MAGASRATLRRQAKKAKAAGLQPAPAAKRMRTEDLVPAVGSSTTSHGAALSDDAECAPCTHSEQDIGQGADASAAPGGTSSYREWQIEAPDKESELWDSLQIAVAQAATIHGRKYRYGALLIAGDDHVPMRSGSNKKPFMRDNIHAEMSVLKGCSRPAGKDMLIARLAPTAPVASVDDEGAVGVRTLLAAGKPRQPKILNARPCENCEAKMVRPSHRRATCDATAFATTLHSLIAAAPASPVGAQGDPALLFYSELDDARGSRVQPRAVAPVATRSCMQTGCPGACALWSVGAAQRGFWRLRRAPGTFMLHSWHFF